MKAETKTTVYFDGSCPLCNAEISVYRKRTTDVMFVDVSQADVVPPKDLSREEAMKRFHIRRRDGTLLNGGDAFIELWRQTPGFRFLGRLLQLPGLRIITNLAYNGFLYFRPTIQKLFIQLNKK